MRAATTIRRGPVQRAVRRPPGRLDSHRKRTDRRGRVNTLSAYSQPHAVTNGSTLQYLNADGTTNVATVTTSSGGLAATISYDPFGSTLSGHGSTISDQLYQSARRDAITGDYQFGSRTYDPAKDAFT